MKKRYLLAPGPTPVPESVLACLAQPIIHHRTAAFEEIFKDVRNNLKYLFQTEQDVMVLSCSGTGTMEACVANLFSKGDTVIVLNAGKFGERWAKIGRSYGLGPIEVKVSAGMSIDPAQVKDAVRANPGAKAILFQANETSTGVELPTQKIAQIAAEAGMLSVCDAITACGVSELPMDKWGLDVVVTGSQKALMLPPGLAMIGLSPKAWASVETATLPKFYFDLQRERKALLKNQTAWTPAISLIVGLRESLRMLREEGLPQVFKRHDLLARATRSGVSAMGLELLAKENPSTSVTAVKVPVQITDGKKIPRIMRESHGVTIAGGQDELEGKIFRLSHFGYCGQFDVMTGISALELTLKELGFIKEVGKGVSATLKTFSEG